MRKILFLILISAFVNSCKKETSCEGCRIDNKPPLAHAGADTTIILPIDSVLLDGSASSDPDGKITEWEWEKISGPARFNISITNAAITQVTKLEKGVYQFELKVTDNNGEYDLDTMQVEIIDQIIPPTVPVIPNPFASDNVNFFCPDPTGTITSINQTWDNGDPVNGLYKMITIKINDSLTGSLAGVWCSNGCSPKCPVTSDYLAEPGNYVSFNLPPGTYRWSAENTILDLIALGFPVVSGELINFFRTAHKAEGTLIVNPGDKCIIQPIKF